MPDEPVASATDPVNEPEPEPTPAEPQPEPEPFDRDLAMDTIRKQRASERQAIQRAKELEAKLREYEQAQLTEQERQARELADLQARQFDWERDTQEARLEAAFYKAAADPKLGVADPELAYAVIDRDQVEYDEAGRPTNLPDLITSLLDAKPLLRTTNQQATQPAPARIDAAAGHGTPNGPTLTADEVEAAQMMGMTPERYAALKGKTVVADALKAAQPTS